ncbi:MAG TPA: phosphotransferase [Actinoplanes sp.]
MEQQMPGGRNHGAVRVGQTVRRRAGTHTTGVHALLRHLESVGFTGAPRALGIDEQGREILTYLDGDTVGDTRPWPAWAHSDAALIATGRWLRDFHAASRSFVPPDGAQWFGDHDDLRPGELIGHHDAAPYNAVWRAAPTPSDPDHGELVGFIDWDLAGPAEPLRDLAFVALTWVPLTARDVAAGDGFPARIDRPRRLRLLLDAYGWEGTVQEVLMAVRRRALDHAVGLRAAADDGYGPAIALVAEGVADSLDRAVAELDASIADFDASTDGRGRPASTAGRGDAT